jgi:DNA-binding transcriptional LysR family regulator
MDRFADMQMFVKVVESAGISAAADRLDVAKSAVSRRLSDLEARLGVQLFQRTTRRMNLTDSGRSFYERCLRILADLDEAELAVSQQHGGLSGKLRVALPLSFGLLHLVPIINAFATAHPEVEFDLDFNDRQIDLMQEGFDVAVRIATLSDSSLIARRISVVRHLVCASPDYLAKHGTPKTPQQLVNHACLGYSNLAAPDIWTYHDAKNIAERVKVPIKLMANNGDFLARAAIAGRGILLQPTFYMADAICRGELVPILRNYQWPELNAYAVYPPTRHLSTRVRAFVDYLVETLSGEPSWDRAITQLLQKAQKRKKAGSK